MAINVCGCTKSVERERNRFAERREKVKTFDRAASAEARACRVLSVQPLLKAVLVLRTSFCRSSRQKRIHTDWTPAFVSAKLRSSSPRHLLFLVFFSLSPSSNEKRMAFNVCGWLTFRRRRNVGAAPSIAGRLRPRSAAASRC